MAPERAALPSLRAHLRLAQQGPPRLRRSTAQCRVSHSFLSRILDSRDIEAFDRLAADLPAVSEDRSRQQQRGRSRSPRQVRKFAYGKS